MRETLDQLSQRIMETQGFVVMADWKPFPPIGTVLNGFHFNWSHTKRDETDAKVVIVGLATKAEAYAQRAMFTPEITEPLREVYFVKVIAE